RRRVAGATSAQPRTTLETVITETFASRAISFCRTRVPAGRAMKKAHPRANGRPVRAGLDSPWEVHSPSPAAPLRSSGHIFIPALPGAYVIVYTFFQHSMLLFSHFVSSGVKLVQ